MLNAPKDAATNHGFIPVSNGANNFRELFREARLGFLLTNRDFRIVWANPAFTSFLGYSPEEVLNLTFKDLTHPDQIENDLKNLKRIIAKEIPAYHTEKRYIKKTGEIIWGSVTVLPILGKSEEMVHFLVMVEDISDRKLIEQEIMEWKKRYDLVSRTSGQAVYDYDIPSGIIKWGGNTQEVLGYTSRELGNIDNWENLIHPEDRKNALEELEEARRRIGVYDCNYRFLHKEGHYVFIRDKGIFIGSNGKGAISMVGMMQDITDLVLAERELVEKERRYRTLFDVSPSGIMLEDLKGNILDVNEAACRFLGYKKTELLGKHVSMLLPDQSKDEIKKHIRMIRTGKAYEHEVVNIRKDGIQLNILLRETLIQLPDGKIGILAITNDITARKKAEQSLHDSREQLQRYAHHLQTIREEERSRISRELHDHLGQYLSAIKMDTSGIIHKQSLAAANPQSDPVLIQAKELMEVIEELIPAVRKIASDLHPRVLDELGLIPGIEWLVEEFIKRSGIPCTLISSVDQINLGPAHAIAVFRIVQEALTNILRHANATRAAIRISGNSKSITVIIEDNGTGIKTPLVSSMKSLGLIGMHERALLLGGELHFRKNGKKGTRVILTIPKY
ncbi:MAG TPA: PAS domain S-box protein [Bacteroidales bacterium]|nr:PAS domain S-box protein [Bacteroidales bacterium]